jgi:hypothetical protein
VVIGQVALLLIVITVLTGVSVWREYDAAVSRAEIQAGNAAQTASEHVRWLYEASTQALRRVDDLLGDHPDAFEAGSVGNLSEAIAALPRDTSLTVYNAQGQSILSTDPDRAQRSIAEREDFRVHFSPATNGTSAPCSTHRRRIGRCSPSAGGWRWTASLPARRWSWCRSNCSRASGPPSISVRDSFASLVRNDGQLVARFPVP